MVEFETIGESKTIPLTSGRFIEISKKAAVTENEKKEFYSIALGEFYLDINNQNAKRYTKNISIPVNKVGEVIEALRSLQ